jgi:hypothetical protein
MNQKKKNIIASRWIVITLAGSLIVLLLAGAIYAQNGGSRRDHRQDQGRGMNMGPGGGMGPGMGSGMGNSMGDEMRGRFGSMAYMMEDPEIRKLTQQIRIISEVNQLGLSNEQVQTLITCARDAQSAVDGQLGSVRDQVKTTLQDQLNNVLAGGEFDQGVLQSLRDDNRCNVDREAINTQMQDTLQRVKDTLTNEQLQQLMEPGPMAERMRDGFQNRHNNQDSDDQNGSRQNWMDRPRIQNWLNNLSEEDRAGIQERIGQRQDRMAEGKITMFLLNPETVDSLQMWLSAH